MSLHLTPQERDRLLLFTAAELARARKARGVKLNVPEATALIADTVAEAARDGCRLSETIAAGRAVLSVDDVMPGVIDVLDKVKVEAVFDDGTRLAVVYDPFGVGSGSDRCVGPGTLLPADEPARDPLSLLDKVTVSVTNTAEVPISVTSHFHFFEANPRLHFVRAAAYGRRLAIPAGAATRFDPSATVEVTLVPIGGDRIVIGFAGLVDGPLDQAGMKESALARARAAGYLGAEGPV